MAERFEGKRLIVTGATSGIGHAGAIRIAREGGIVIATGRNEDRLAELRNELPAQCLVVHNDAADPECGSQLREAVEQGGGLDGLWLNAGYADMAPLDKVDADFFDRMMAANVRGPVLQMAALSGLLNENASVVVTSSTSAEDAGATNSVYAATKGAITSLMRSWAIALGPRRIRVNALVPGPIDSDFRAFLSEQAREGLEAFVKARLTLARIGTTDEAAAVALFLLSDESSFVTGTQYAVDGGR